MSVSVGDAVLTFLGDMTPVDAAFASLGPKAKAAIQPATAAMGDLGDAADDAGKNINKIPAIPEPVPESAKSTARTMREARGEAMLLGEAIGIHLPRHVTTFLAELPGVQTALSAAFSATAVLFLVKALAEGADKLSNWVGNTFIFTKAMRDSDAALKGINISLLDSAAVSKKATDALAELSDTRTPLQKLQSQLAANNAEIDKIAFNTEKVGLGTELEAKKRVDALQAENALLQKQIDLQKEQDALQQDSVKLKQGNQQIEQAKAFGNAMFALQEAQSKALIVGIQQNEAMGFAIEQTFQKKRFDLALSTLKAKLEIEKQYGHDNEDVIKAISAEIVTLTVQDSAKIIEVQNNLKTETTKLLADLQRSFKEQGPVDIVPPEAVQRILTLDAAAKALGITLKSQLVSALNTAREAFKEMVDSGFASKVELEDARKKVAELQKQVDQFGIDQDKFKAHTEATWNNIIAEWGSKAPQALANLRNMGVQTFNQIAQGMQSAVAGAILGEESFSKAIEKATAQALASLASQAAVKALFYTAEGFASLAVGDSEGATAFFEGAALMAAVGAAAGVAAHALSNAGGNGAGGVNGANPNSRGQVFQYGSSGSNTTSQAGSGRSGVGVQGFADGGLVSRPTLAMIGEGASREAVLPLDDPRAMATIGKAVAAAIEGHGGGGNHFHVNVAGMISDDNLSKVMAKMSKKVLRGQGSLHSSNSLRITKRSA